MTTANLTPSSNAEFTKHGGRIEFDLFNEWELEGWFIKLRYQFKFLVDGFQ